MDILRDVRLNESARRTLTVACEEALAHSQAVAPAHILLAMSRVAGPGQNVIRDLCGNVAGFRVSVEALLPDYTEPLCLPVRWTDSAKRLVRFAETVASAAGERDVSQLHLLFAGATEEAGRASFLLEILGVPEHQSLRRYVYPELMLSA